MRWFFKIQRRNCFQILEKLSENPTIKVQQNGGLFAIKGKAIESTICTIYKFVVRQNGREVRTDPSAYLQAPGYGQKSKTN